MIAPSVPTPDSWPTTVPVRSNVSRRSFVTIGVTADNSEPGTRIASDATGNRRAGANSPTKRSNAGITATAAPATPTAGPINRCGSTTSAARPPPQDPNAIAASAMPITSVLVSSVSPR